MNGSLVSLAACHAAALETFLQDFDAAPKQLHGYFCGRDWPIEKAVASLQEWSRGENIKSGWVPCSTWFWESEGALMGVINVRHWLSPSLHQTGGHIGYSVAPSHRRKGVATAMLAAVLDNCRKLGIDRVLLTCDANNIASIRTIEVNGGTLEKEEWLASEQRIQRWYWIDLNQ